LIEKKLHLENEVAEVKRANQNMCATFHLSIAENNIFMERAVWSHKNQINVYAERIKSLRFRLASEEVASFSTNHAIDMEVAHEQLLRSKLHETETTLSHLNQNLKQRGLRTFRPW